MTTASRHPGERHGADLTGRLNWLRAGVLGANDGIISIAGLVVGVAGATGAVSMAIGEYVSVSSQRDTELALLAKERGELADLPDEELAELAALYQEKGLSPGTARRVAEELTAKDGFRAHADAELHIDPDALTNPWHAAGASAVAFTAGALLPLAAILLPPADARVPVTFGVVVAALAFTGYLSARLGGAGPGRAVTRLVIGGLLAMLVTFGIGQLIGTTVT